MQGSAGPFDFKNVAVDLLAALIVEAIDALQREVNSQATDVTFRRTFPEPLR
jgi:hypothetical protein